MESEFENPTNILLERRDFIDGYFDKIKNTLDIEMAKINSSPNHLNEQEKKELNELYTSFINEIEEVKRYNLNSLEETNNFLTDNADNNDDDTKKVVFKKFCFLIDLNEAKKDYKIRKPCKPKLVISDFYVDDRNQSLYKSYLSERT